MKIKHKSYLASQITHEGAELLISAIVDQAQSMNANVCIAIVDNRATLVGFLRMDDAMLVSIELSQKKARSAASLGLSPERCEEILEQEQPRVKDGLSVHPDVSYIRGGSPIVFDGSIIGAIGVSGGSESQDMQCVEAGLKAFEL